MHKVTVKDAVKILNDLLKIDAEVVTNLVNIRVDGSQLMKKDKLLDLRHAPFGRPTIGLLEVMNRLLTADQRIRIECVMAKDDRIARFIILEESASE